MKTYTAVMLDLSEHVEDLSVELEFKPYEDPIVHHDATSGVTVVGYLSHDDHCGNPLEDSDCMGQIYTARRRASHEHLEAFRKAKGLDENWERTRKPNPLAVSLDVYSHSGEVYAVSGSARAQAFPDRQWDVGSGSAVWVPDANSVENIWINAVKQLLPADVKVEYKSRRNADGTAIRRPARCGETPYFLDGTCIDERYSNRPTLLVSGKKDRAFKSFKAAYRAALKDFGVKLPDNFAELQYREAVKMCEDVLESFNAWLSGDCYGVVVEVFDKEGKRLEHDSCWGYIGHRWALEELQSQAAAACKTHFSCSTAV
jgi:hypothetical protein